MRRKEAYFRYDYLVTKQSFICGKRYLQYKTTIKHRWMEGSFVKGSGYGSTLSRVASSGIALPFTQITIY